MRSTTPDPIITVALATCRDHGIATQRGLAQVIGVHEATISLYASGRRHPDPIRRAALEQLIAGFDSQASEKGGDQ